MRRLQIISCLIGAAALVGCGGQTGTSDYTTSRGISSYGTETVSNELATKGAKLLSIDGKPTFVAGVNLPWFDDDFSHDLGPNPFHPNDKIWYTPDVVDADYKDISDSGLKVVRLWVFEGGEGLQFDKDGYTTGLDSTFVNNLKDVVDKAKAHGLKLYMCLSGSWKDLPVKSPILDPKAQTAYIDNAVVPIAKLFRGEHGIFAFDVMNEIESDVAGKEGNWTDKGATWDQARAFIRANVQAIKKTDPGRLVSSGSGWHNWENVQKGHYSGLGLDFYDVHQYDDKGDLPIAKDLKADKPIILGEFGQSSKKWDDDAQKNADSAFVRAALAKGYAGFLVWTYGHKGSEEVHSLIGKDGQHRPAFQAILDALNTELTSEPETTKKAKK
jgi:endo-1,4-beta-mannosidase